MTRFQISETGYEEAITWLQSRFGREEVIVEQLYAKLEKLQAEGQTTKEQRKLLDQVATTMTQLASKGQDVNHLQVLNQVFRKFAEQVQTKALKRRIKLPSASMWTWQKLREDLEDIISTKERMEETQALNAQIRRERKQGERPKAMTPSTCFYCNKSNHKPVECRTVPPHERAAFMIRNNLCQRKGNVEPKENKQVRGNQPNQLPTGQNGPRATTQRRSAVRQNLVAEDDYEDTGEPNEEVQDILQVSSDGVVKKLTRLLTGMVCAKGPGSSKSVQILLDTGSELSFIDKQLADELKLESVGSRKLRINTFGSKTSKEGVYEQVNVNLQDTMGGLHTLSLFKNDLITKSTTQDHLQKRDWAFIKTNGLEVSQPKGPSCPQILLGCDQLWDIMSGSMIKLPSGLHLIATKFGYMISGKQSNDDQEDTTLLAVATEEERERWDKLWTLESAGLQEYTGTLKDERELTDKAVLKKFNETVVKQKDGYYVRLPWKEEHVELPDNWSIALRRLKATFQVHRHNQTFLQQYDEIFQEQIKKGILEEVREPQKRSKVTHYLPHHAVLTPKKTTTKMRVVFDASAHYKDKPSLNDVLHQGPLILPKIVGMIMRFRIGRIAVTSDVEKAFLQFHVEHDEADKMIAEDIHNNLYVDNLFMTAETPQEAFKKYKEAKELFNRLNMNLREFTSNSVELNQQIKQEDRSDETKPSTLGLTWDTQADKMVLRHLIKESKKVTKRSVLSTMAAVYDPMGFLIPLTIQAKRFFQGLWKKDYKWDQDLEEEDAIKWQQICEDTKGFTKEIPRRIAERNSTYRIVMFTDASAQAMCATAYLSNENSQYLLIAKSRLPSIQSHHTIPKMEMMAITMGVRLALNTYLEVKTQIKITELFILSDSEIALSWVKAPPNTKNTGVLVANRVKEIIKITRRLEEEGAKVRFGYVNTKDNPADEGTRGSDSKGFADSLWWTGPAFTKNDPDTWPKESRLFQIQEEETSQVTVVKQERDANWPEDSGATSLKGLRRTTAYVLRFIRNITERLSEPLKRRIKKTIPELGREQARGHITGLEASLNSRPLTYQEAEYEANSGIRPIDFIQKEIQVTYPLETQPRRLENEEEYLPPEEAIQLRTRKQAQEALNKSYELTKRFWNIWSKNYLTDLRNLHKTRLNQGRSSPQKPKRGQVVLIVDPNQPRNVWRLARISKLNGKPGESPREAEIVTSSGRRQRRPINLLVPLELDEGEHEEMEPTVRETLQPPRTEKGPEETHSQKRYNLRPTRNYPVEEIHHEQSEDEMYTVNTITDVGDETTIEQPHSTPMIIENDHNFSMNRARMYMEQLRSECRKFMEEEDVQGSLETDYYMTTKVIEDAAELAKEYKTLRNKILSLKDEDTKAFAVEACEWFQKATRTVMKISAIRDHAMLLWEIYTILVETGFARSESMRAFRNKPRAEGRPINRETTSAILLSEAQELGQIIADFRSMVKREFYGYVETPNEPNVKIEELDQAPEPATSTAAPPSVVATSADLVVPALEEYSQKMQKFQKKLENLLKNQSKAEEVKTRVDKLEEEIRETKSQLLAAVSEIGKKLEEKIEVTIEAQIQQLVLVKKLCEAKETPAKDEIHDLPSGRGEVGPQEADRKDSYRPHDRHHGEGDKHVYKRRPQLTHVSEEQPPEQKRRRVNNKMELEAIRLKLENMKHCRTRLYKDETFPVKDRNKNLVVCPFCDAIGKHIADRCPIHRSVKDRRAIMAARINTCWFCFKEAHPTCPARVPCMYCASTNHHTSVCSLPEERAKWSA
ncbi:Pao retrotransposon peptidase, partial [Ancylostoma ceylanicum]